MRKETQVPGSISENELNRLVDAYSGMLLGLCRLTLDDLPAKRTPAPNTVSELDGTVLLHQDIDTAGISYLTLYFSLADMPAEELSRISILAHLMRSSVAIRGNSGLVARITLHPAFLSIFTIPSAFGDGSQTFATSLNSFL